MGRNAVGDVDDAHVGRNRADHRVDNTYKLILVTKIGQEGDRGIVHQSKLTAPEPKPDPSLARCAVLAGLGVAISEIEVNVVGTKPVRAPHTDSRQFARLDESVDRHGRYSH